MRLNDDWRAGRKAPITGLQVAEAMKTLRFSLSSEPWRQAFAGVLGGLAGWAVVEPFFHEGGCVGRWGMGNAFYFPVVVGMISSALLLADALPRERFSSAAALAFAGFGVAFGLGFLFQMPSHLLFAWLSPLGDYPPDAAGSGNFWLALMARGLAWGGLGVVVGLGPGIVTGNWRRYSAAGMGGLFGGLVAGLSFDPLQVWLHPITGEPAWASRVAGFAIMGGMAGFVNGVVSDITRQFRLVVLSGSRMGTQVLLDAGPCLIGTSPQCTMVLTEEEAVLPIHAVIQKVGFGFEIQQEYSHAETLVNGQPLTRKRLADGDRIRVGHTTLAFFSG